MATVRYFNIYIFIVFIPVSQEINNILQKKGRPDTASFSVEKS